MSTMVNCATMNTVNEAPRYEVIHPLDDVREEKCSLNGLGHMHMSPSVKLSLYALRGYLICMGLLVAFRVVTLTGAFGSHLH